MENVEFLEKLYWSMYRIRRTEEEIARIYPSDKIKSPVHLSIGQEAVAVGVCNILHKNDIVFSFYRSHAHYLAKGGDLKKLMAELYGKLTGCCKGKGGSMHLIDISAGFMGTSAIVGTGIPQAVGYAYAAKLKGTGQVVVNFFGDGSVEEGSFHESINFAALHKLPIIFICENNRYAINTPLLDRQPIDNIWERAKAFGMPSVRVEKNDLMNIYVEAKKAIEAIRETGQGPYFIECMTYRWREHVGPGDDFNIGYRTKEEVNEWIKDDQLTKLGSMLDKMKRNEIEELVNNEIAVAIDFAESSPFPPEESLMCDVYKEN